jgi:hypothetical protein
MKPMKSSAGLKRKMAILALIPDEKAAKQFLRRLKKDSYRFYARKGRFPTHYEKDAGHALAVAFRVMGKNRARKFYRMVKVKA